MRAVTSSALALAVSACVGLGGHASPEPAPAPSPIDPAGGHDESPPAPAIARAPAIASTDPPPTPGAEQAPFFVSEPDARPTFIRDARRAPNVRYADMTREGCLTELTRRQITFAKGPAVWNVRAPVFLRGPLHGVRVHSRYVVPGGSHAPLEIMGCRLVLALDDFSALLAAHDIVEVLHLSAWRSRKEGGCTPKYDGKQHCAALALDVAAFKRRDGSVIDVKRDFRGKVGVATCAPGAAPKPASEKASLLWSLVCDAAARGLFHVILTPNYNAQHHDHLHLEIAPDAEWMLVK